MGMWRGLHRAASGVQPRGRWLLAALALLLVTASVGGADHDATDGGPPTATTSAAAPEEASQTQVAAAATSGAPRDVRGVDLSGGRSVAEASATTGDAATVEELLEQGLRLAGVSPVHLVIRGSAAADSIRCAWRGIARTPSQREDAIRFWLRLGPDDPIPDAAYLAIFFTVILDGLDPEFRETAKSNFLAIARGGLSTEYLFLACYADYTTTAYLLGTGPTTVTVAYDRMDEARSYELYAREHETGQFGDEALQTRGAYEASLQELMVGAEQDLSARIGGLERVVFLAPMGAHNAIAIEAWQAVAEWTLETADGTANAVRVGVPAGDPEHTQTLANLTSRITAATTSDPR